MQTPHRKGRNGPSSVLNAAPQRLKDQQTVAFYHLMSIVGKSCSGERSLGTRGVHILVLVNWPPWGKTAGTCSSLSSHG